MRPSPVMSRPEASANVAIGHGIAAATRVLAFPAVGLHTALAQNLR